MVPSLPRHLSKPLVLLFLLVLLVVGALPNYVTEQWPWSIPPQATSLKLKSLEQVGLSLPGWRTLSLQAAVIGGRNWLVQTIQQSDAADSAQVAALLLLPQSGPAERPQVEWTDLNGFEQWRTDSAEQRQFMAVPLGRQTATTVNARFLRGWTHQQTYAVLQWYAWPTGGDPAPSRWFLSDRLARWRSQTASAKAGMPWVAVNVQLAIEPLGDIEQAWPTVQSLGQAVQAALIAGPLQT